MSTIEDKISNILKGEHDINPSEDFKTRSRNLILGEKQRSPSFLYTIKREFAENLKFGATLALATFLLFVIFSGFTYWGSIFPNTNLESSRGLLSEAENVDFEIELREVEYYEDSAEEIAMMLRGIQEDSEEDIDTLLETF